MRLGELCAGYGGLGMAVEEVFGATTAWFSEFDEAPSKILAHHWPHVPNHGDMTKIDWANIEPVDIISGGTPCQDLSAAGRRAGMTEGTRSNLWVQMREAVAIQRPKYVVWENVRGAYSATAASDLEQCTGCMGDTGDGGVVLRALGRVLGDLSDLGYDCQWRGLRAADVGACHGRFRVFVLAQDRDGGRSRRGAVVAGNGEASRADTQTHGADYRSGRAGTTSSALATNSIGGGRFGGTRASGREAVKRVAPEWAGERDITLATDTERLRSERRGVYGNMVGTQGAREANSGERERDGDAADDSQSVNWGDYEPAIRRWESRLGRPAPRPTEPTGRNGGHRLSPRFTEWMLGLPDGWVTDPAIGISRNDQLKACGNGVVPQQAITALTDMLAAFEQGKVAA